MQDLLVQDQRNQAAAERFLRRVLDGEGAEPRVGVTDKLASYPPAVKRVVPTTQHRRHKGLNIRAENSHRPVRTRERALQRFKSPGHPQCFLEPFSAVRRCADPLPSSSPRPLRRPDRQLRTHRSQQWREAARLSPAS